MTAQPIIALLSDFGLVDGYVGVLKGVLLGIAPRAQLVDVTHDVPPQDIRTGAWLLSTAWRYFPTGTIFLCIVDPGVGTARRPLALRADERLFVGPDNGLFSLVLATTTTTTAEAVQLDNPAFHLPEPSATFHGRDIFAPCAAHLASGIPLEALGAPLDPASCVSLALPQPSWHGVALVAHVLHIDRFGNLITTLDPVLTSAVLGAATATTRIADHSITARAATFSDGPEGAPFMLRDSSGHLAIAVRNGSAASVLGVGRDAEMTIIGLRG
jgi:S-adenosyl-L-methionine hydrolase (adenosine-forming)